jgi:competence protein ComEA
VRTPDRTPEPTPTKVALASSTAKPAITPDGRVNINVAGLDELLTLPRMTKEVAQEILEHRSKNGPFRDAHSIVDVPSIGEAAYARMRDKIAVD